MIQRIRNYITLNVTQLDLGEVSDVQVTIEQQSSGCEFTYADENVLVVGPHLLTVTVPKDDAMKLDKKNVKGQIMYTDSDGVPRATKVFILPVEELLKEDGYGD